MVVAATSKFMMKNLFQRREYMTKREAAIISAYTGYLIGEFSDFHVYVEEIMERPIFTHELPSIAEDLREKSKEDFMNIKIRGVSK